MYSKPKDVALRYAMRRNDWTRNDDEEDLLFVPRQHMPFADGGVCDEDEYFSCSWEMGKWGINWGIGGILG